MLNSFACDVLICVASAATGTLLSAGPLPSATLIASGIEQRGGCSKFTGCHVPPGSVAFVVILEETAPPAR